MSYFVGYVRDGVDMHGCMIVKNSRLKFLIIKKDCCIGPRGKTNKKIAYPYRETNRIPLGKRNASLYKIEHLLETRLLSGDILRP